MKDEDINYVAGLEKAIKKKYGDEAIQNPASLWDESKETEYLKQLQDFIKKQQKLEAYVEPENVNGILITQKLFNKNNKIICPVCKSRNKTINDNIYHIKYECCHKCYIKFVENREERWLKGWRPKNVTKSS
jgi:mRNA-degrading endonuclease HigB of HigAB toxin-antitoxin module